jgi:hypothetical protein
MSKKDIKWVIRSRKSKRARRIDQWSKEKKIKG